MPFPEPNPKRMRTLRITAAALLLACAGLASSAAAAPAGAVPVLCTAVVAEGTTELFSCIRHDTGAAFDDVPAGQFLHVTDILITRLGLVTTGDFYAFVGRYNGLALPASPVIRVSGTPLDPTRLHFTTPVIVLQSDENLAARNDVSSDFPLNVYAIGFLAPSGSL